MLGEGRKDLGRNLDEMKNTDGKISDIQRQLATMQLDPSINEEIQRKQHLLNSLEGERKNFDQNQDFQKYEGYLTFYNKIPTLS